MTILAHDYLLVMRGAERTFLEMCALYPQQPVAALLYDRDVFDDHLGDRPVATSRYQRLGARQGSFKPLLPMFPAAAERLPMQGHELVLSSSSAFAHGLRADPGAVHVCYCHTPFRYAWHERQAGVAQVPPPLQPVLGRILERVRRWDLEVAQRDTHYVANSRITQARIRRYWGREAPIVYPPVDLSRFAPAEAGDFFLVVGELVRHKQVEIALAAARDAKVPIKIVGGGADEARLAAEYGEHAEFLGRVSDDELARLYAEARALVIPGIEEFGITAVEAQATGRPVIAADGGGARETVIDGETGLFFPQGDVAALSAAMRSPLLDEMEPSRAVANAQRFSAEVFRAEFSRQVDAALAVAGAAPNARSTPPSRSLLADPTSR